MADTFVAVHKNIGRKAEGEKRSTNLDALVDRSKTPFSVIRVKTGIQEIQEVLDSRSPPAWGQASRE